MCFSIAPLAFRVYPLELSAVLRLCCGAHASAQGRERVVLAALNIRSEMAVLSFVQDERVVAIGACLDRAGGFAVARIRDGG